MTFKTPLNRLRYMREYYQTEKYKAWQRAYRKKQYKENAAIREKQISKAKERYHRLKKDKLKGANKK